MESRPLDRRVSEEEYFSKSWYMQQNQTKMVDFFVVVDSLYCPIHKLESGLGINT